VETDRITAAKAGVEREHGTWTAHNLRLPGGLHTISEQPTGDEVKLARVLQVVADIAALSGRSIADLRILDLAALEGMYALELAAHGAQVLAIEGREANLAKARFAADALDLATVEFELGDVRDLSPERHGTFDVVLCLGILYHLDAPDVFAFLERIGSVCRSAAVIDTWVAGSADEQREHGDERYFGVSLFEHEPDDPEETRQARVWSSLDNARAFAPTWPSLLRLLARSGFTSAFECWLPPEGEKPSGRVTLLAVKGTPLLPTVVDAPPSTFPREPAASRLSARDVSQRARSLLRRLLRRPLRRL
jgi:SAM-dependent methyltransferase